MIVKVQAFQVDGKPTVEIYNRDRSVFWEGPITLDVVRIMAGRVKVFCHADMKNDDIDLYSEAPWQEW